MWTRETARMFSRIYWAISWSLNNKSTAKLENLRSKFVESESIRRRNRFWNSFQFLVLWLFQNMLFFCPKRNSKKGAILKIGGTSRKALRQRRRYTKKALYERRRNIFSRQYYYISIFYDSFSSYLPNWHVIRTNILWYFHKQFQFFSI